MYTFTASNIESGTDFIIKNESLVTLFKELKKYNLISETLEITEALEFIPNDVLIRIIRECPADGLFSVQVDYE